MTMTTTKSKSRKQTSRQRTIAPELLDQWKRLRRAGDSVEIAKTLNLSKGVIDNALIYGHVCQQATIDGICKFFADRIRREIDKANELKQLVSGHAAAVA